MNRLVAEFIGTFALVFAGTGAIIINDVSDGAITHVGIALTFGLVVMAMIYAVGDVSGAHLNPAVTLGLLAIRKIRPNDAAVYILLQLAGAVAAALMTKFLLIDDLADQQNVGATALNLSILGGDFQGFIAELLGTFFLVWAVVAVAVNPRAARDWAGWAIGGTLGFVILIIGPLTGGAVNPARWFGPALVSGEWNTPLLYIFAPLVGGVLAALTYWYLFVEGPTIRAATPETGPKGLRQDVNPPG